MVYAKHGQKAPEEMLSNRVADMSDAAKSFFGLLNVSSQELALVNLVSKEFTWNGFESMNFAFMQCILISLFF